MPALFCLMAGLFTAGCASTVSKILPIGEPVTKERCEQIDVKALGFKDAKNGQRPGDKFDFWKKDCAAFGVTLDRALYDQGYQEGMAYYCSCENGFVAGVKEEIAEFKKQFMLCSKADYKHFISGHQMGKKHSKDENLVKKTGLYKKEYNEDAIVDAAKAHCKEAGDCGCGHKHGHDHDKGKDCGCGHDHDKAKDCRCGKDKAAGKDCGCKKAGKACECGKDKGKDCQCGKDCKCAKEKAKDCGCGKEKAASKECGCGKVAMGKGCSGDCAH